MPACNGTYKNGITFSGWSTVPGFESYFHPFGCTLDVLTFRLFQSNTVLRRKGVDVHAHPNRFFVMRELTDRGLAPIAPENFPFQFDYAYHFDSALVGQFLRDKALERGVQHVQATVRSVRQLENGDIAAIVLDDGQELTADFWVDCSGFASVLLQKTLGVPFNSYADSLYNDAAVAMPSDMLEDIPAQTVSAAMNHGWAWEIPLTSRFGNGYVYSSGYCSADEAETELRDRLGLLDSEVEARHLKMKVGRAFKSWSHNCVAIGLSQGFIEPLEATALQLVNTSIEEFIAAFEYGGFTAQHRDAFNQRANFAFDAIRDYIVLHYKSNSRDDTPYWRDAREKAAVSDNLRTMLDCWHNINNLDGELRRLGIEKIYTDISWCCLRAGVGLFPAAENLQAARADLRQADMDYVDRFVRGCALNFQPHREVLARQTPGKG
jgi:hypothetical protein